MSRGGAIGIGRLRMFEITQKNVFQRLCLALNVFQLPIFDILNVIYPLVENVHLRYLLLYIYLEWS